ncbi:hypothetical protein BIU82_13450 [Arthrobacter sp. SW1]|uniref:PoNe immunity protein domain-containing protein n=1 Tax=Arthrobacter sp. SW1 TaxID=1920889 RepID=UPI000877CEEB|nr:PoNe immunity protein domain-containing protein [Arthrobacter sp. SW1]OFI36498.1 hypothetical protein BIU82_13450 [Arthrobacter sp. SW1]
MGEKMVRDTRADQAYFDGVVEYLRGICGSTDERLARPLESFRKPEILGLGAGNAMKQRWDLFASLYAQGASASELRAEFEVLLLAAERARRLSLAHVPADYLATRFGFGKDKDFYREWLLLVALALAFDVDDAIFDRAVAAVEFGWGDQLLDRLIASRRPDHPVGEALAFPKIVGKLNAAFDAGPSGAAPAVAKYLSSWYSAWKGSWGWGGHEQVKKRQYHGYWAFETLGVVKALGLGDASFRDNEYYPRDLAGLRKPNDERAAGRAMITRMADTVPTPTLYIGRDAVPVAGEILSWPPLRALGLTVEQRALVNRDSVLEQGDLFSGNAIAQPEEELFEWRVWDRGAPRTVMRSNALRLPMLELLRSTLAPALRVASCGEVPGVEVSSDAGGTRLSWAGESWAWFLGRSSFAHALPLMQLITASDEELEWSVRSADGSPLFAPAEAVRQEQLSSGAFPALLDHDSWRTWLDSQQG